MEITRSKFVTVFAWIFIMGSGFGTLLLLLQIILFNYLYKKLDFLNMDKGFPAIIHFFFEYFQFFLFIFLMIEVAVFISSIGLLKRKNWARLISIGVLLIGIIWNLASIVFQLAAFNFQATFMQWVPAIISIGISILFAWIIKKLVSTSIKNEFIT